jgi:hypothetical protein
MKKVAFFLCIYFLQIWTSYLVSGQCVKKNTVFQAGERLKYQAYYNWGFIWVYAGDCEFSVQTKLFQSKPVYYFQTSGTSLKSYDWIYKVRDTYNSYADINTLQPYFAERNTYEGSYRAHEKYQFFPSRNKIAYEVENSDNPNKKDSVKYTPCTFDVLSAVYYCRTIDFENYTIDQRIPVKTIIDGNLYSLYLRYKGKETIKHRDGKSYQCIKFSALLVEGTIFKGGEDMFIWVTDDANRVPVLVEAKILIGSVKGYLTKMEGLRNK